MRWVLLMCGVITTAAMIAISMRLNFLFGAALGRTPEKSLVFGVVSVAADVWKGLGPIFIVVLWRSRRRPPAIAATIVWFPCFLFSVSSALGLAIQDRAGAVGGRESLLATFSEARADLEDLEGKRRALPPYRAAAQIEAAINAQFTQPVVASARIRGTVRSLSAGCTKPNGYTSEACAEIARLHEELAAAGEGARLEVRIVEMRRKVDRLRERGAGQDSDPQAELLSRLTLGWLAIRDVGPTLALLLATVVELVSAFGPVVLAAYADASRHDRFAEAASTVDYMLDRLEPGEEGSAIGAEALFADYSSWCASNGKGALAITTFIEEFDRSRIHHGLSNIKKLGNRYSGVKLASTA